MVCKDCIHYDACKDMYDGYKDDFDDDVSAEFCDYFKNKADVVEVVRCKDCKRCYEKRTKRNKQLMRFCMRMDGNEYQVNANDFCSYGERRG
jgi:hypothetical protein